MGSVISKRIYRNFQNTTNEETQLFQITRLKYRNYDILKITTAVDRQVRSVRQQSKKKKQKNSRANEF